MIPIDEFNYLSSGAHNQCIYVNSLSGSSGIAFRCYSHIGKLSVEKHHNKQLSRCKDLSKEIGLPKPVIRLRPNFLSSSWISLIRSQILN